MSEPLTFEREAFARSIRVRMAEHGWSIRDAAPLAFVSPATLHRCAKKGGNGQPDVQSYLRILDWLERTKVEAP